MAKLTLDEALTITQKNCRTSDAVTLLTEYGFRKEPSSLAIKRWTNADHPDVTVMFDDRRKEMDSGVLKTIAHSCDIIRKRNESITEKSSDKLPEWLKLEEGFKAHVEEGKLEVYKDTHPEMRLTLNLSGKAQDSFAVNFKQFQEKTLPAYLQKAFELSEQYGVTFERSGGHIRIAQDDYGISHSAPIRSIRDPMQLLANIDDECSTEITTWLVKRDDTLKQLGFETSVKQTENPAIKIFSFRHPELAKPDEPPVEISLTGKLERMDREGMDAIDAAIAQLERLRAPAPVAQVKIRKRTELAQQPAESLPPAPEGTAGAPRIFAGDASEGSLWTAKAEVPLIQLKRQMKELFYPEGKFEMPNTVIARETVTAAEALNETHGNGVIKPLTDRDVSRIMGISNETVPNIEPKRLQEMGVLLSTALVNMTGNQEKSNAFDVLFEQFAQRVAEERNRSSQR